MADGLFAEYGFDVALLEPAGGPANAIRVAEGGADLCLTSVAYYLKARAMEPDLAARFVGVITQRSPMAGIVPVESTATQPSDLTRLRVGGGDSDGGLLAEYLAGFAYLGLPPPQVVPLSHADARKALRDGEVDSLADFVDLIPQVRRLTRMDVRAVPLGTDVYASGLVAADRLPDELVSRVRAAVVVALERQRREPERGLAKLCQRYPEADPVEAVEGWRLIEPLIFTAVPPGSMESARWEETVRHTAAAHGLAAPAAEHVYRREFAA